VSLLRTYGVRGATDTSERRRSPNRVETRTPDPPFVALVPGEGLLWRAMDQALAMTMSERSLPGARRAPTLTTIGSRLNLRSSILLGPHLYERFGVVHGRYVPLIALPVLVDRFQRRVRQSRLGSVSAHLGWLRGES
jgi:hypothetical protein